MKAQEYKRQRTQAGSLVLVLVVTAAGILLVTGVLTWTSTNSDLTQRLHRHDRSVAAAGAATEKVISHMMRDFYSGGNTVVANNLGVYRTLVPGTNDVQSPDSGGGGGGGGGGLIGGIIGVIGGVVGIVAGEAETAELTKYEFSDAQDNVGRTYVDAVYPWTFTNIPSRYPGLKGYSARYRIVSNSRNLTTRSENMSGVKQELVVASIPVFQYQVFYAPDLEFHPGAAMTLNGRVHCNGMIYSQPYAPVTFGGPVTTSKRLLRDRHPLDPMPSGTFPAVCQGGYEAGANPLYLPLGTNIALSGFRSIVEIPPAGESTNSVLGKQRLYNKADLILLVSNNVAVAMSGAYNNFAVKIPWTNIGERVVITGGKGKGGGKSKGKGKNKQIGITNVYDGVFSTNVTFFNPRENKWIQAVEIDIVELLDKYMYLTGALGRPPRTIYVADMRSQSGGGDDDDDGPTTQSGIRVVYGETLPTQGLTIVTPNPLYLEGDYNVPSWAVGTTNISASASAAIIADAVTIHSEGWYDTNGSRGISYRVASNTTVNAAIIAGIVPSGSGYYSGGLENLPRLMEDWTGKTLTINGSLVCLWYSKIARAPWGSRPDVYRPPRYRNWYFNPKFNSLAGLPPSTPEVRTVIRRGWEVVQAKRVN
jgi:hypothetical protein